VQPALAPASETPDDRATGSVRQLQVCIGVTLQVPALQHTAPKHDWAPAQLTVHAAPSHWMFPPHERLALQVMVVREASLVMGQTQLPGPVHRIMHWFPEQ
jgi:hypothetical protein